MIDPWYLQVLRCPIDGAMLRESASGITCEHGHDYPVEDGMPIMLTPDQDVTIPGMVRSKSDRGAPWYLDSVFISDQERQALRSMIDQGYSIDPVAAFLVGATNGVAYKGLVGRIQTYPIPDIRLSDGSGKALLDIGCSWGRWSIAAARKNYQVVGIDPSLGAVMAARRIARELKLSAKFVVGDARKLPFAENTIDQVFSYSVIQHFSKEHAREAFQEIGRVLRSDGQAMIQMPTKYGIRCLYNRLRRGFSAPKSFEVRYWGRTELKKALQHTVGPSRLTVDCFYGIGWQPSDAGLMPGWLRMILYGSEATRFLARAIPPLAWFADSVYVESKKSSA